MSSRYQQQTFDYSAEAGHTDGTTQVVTGTVIAATRREAIQTIHAALRARGLDPLDVTLSDPS